MAGELEGSLARACSDVAAVMAGPYTGHDVLEEIGVRAADVLRAGSAGVLQVGPDGEQQLAVATDALVADVHAAELEIGEGPSYDARRTGKPVAVPTLVDAGRRWTRWTEVARVHGVGAWLVVPSRRMQRPAALVLASSRARSWSEEDLATAQVLADLAAACAARDAELGHARQAVEQLQQILDHQIVIEQAKGIVAGERGCTLDEAFEHLRDRARSSNATVRSIAEGVVRLGG